MMVASDELIDKMGEVVRSITLKSFDPAKYPNPALQWHYRILQAVALEEELPEKPEDKTLPKYNSIHKRVGPLALEWGELLDKDVSGAQPVENTKKRKAVTNSKEADAKKVKREKKEVEA